MHYIRFELPQHVWYLCLSLLRLIIRSSHMPSLFPSSSVPPPFLPPRSVRSWFLSHGSITHRNNDIENTPVVVVAEPAEEADIGAGGKMGGGLRTYPICYSPCYYYFRVVICIIALVVAIMSWISYTKQCSEWSGAMLPEAWFFTVIVLWGLQGLTHLYFIIARFVTKHPPSDNLYEGGIEAILKLPLMIGLVILVVVSIVGLIFIHAPAAESQTCSDELKGIIRSRAIGYIVLCILLLLRIGGLRK